MSLNTIGSNEVTHLLCQVPFCTHTLLPQSQKDGDGPQDAPGEGMMRPEESVSLDAALFVLQTSVRTLLEKVAKYDAVTQVTECRQILH